MYIADLCHSQCLATQNKKHTYSVPLHTQMHLLPNICALLTVIITTLDKGAEKQMNFNICQEVCYSGHSVCPMQDAQTVKNKRYTDKRHKPYMNNTTVRRV